MYCAAFVSSPGEGRRRLQAICRQRPRRSVICGLIANKAGKPCRKSIEVMDQPRESARIAASMRSRDRFQIRGLRFSSQHSRPRLCWAISSSTSLSIFRARKTACCRAPKTAQPPNCRRTDNSRVFVSSRRKASNELPNDSPLARRDVKVWRPPASTACLASPDSRPRFRPAGRRA
jgi:hypothetical protein